MAKTEDMALMQRQEESAELATASASAAAQHEIQSAIVIARRFARNEDAAFEKLMRSCDRPSFAQDAEYIFPRGGSNVRGPGVNVAREAARAWGNIRYGLYVVRDDADSRQVRGWAWDLETNTKVEAEDDFKKLIYRKKGGWIKPDERDLRELTNRRGAILVRNCLLQLLPRDLIEDAIGRCRQTLTRDASQNPEAARKSLILAFSQLGVSVEMLEAKLSHKIAESSPAEIAELRAVYSSIKDGNSTWREYVEESGNGGAQTPNTGNLSMDDLKEKKESEEPAGESGPGNGKPLPLSGGKAVAGSKQKQLIDAWEKQGCAYDALGDWLKHHGVLTGAVSSLNVDQWEYLMDKIVRGDVETGREAVAG